MPTSPHRSRAAAWRVERDPELTARRPPVPPTPAGPPARCSLPSPGAHSVLFFVSGSARSSVATAPRRDCGDDGKPGYPADLASKHRATRRTRVSMRSLPKRRVAHRPASSAAATGRARRPFPALDRPERTPSASKNTGGTGQTVPAVLSVLPPKKPPSADARRTRT